MATLRGQSLKTIERAQAIPMMPLRRALRVLTVPVPCLHLPLGWAPRVLTVPVPCLHLSLGVDGDVLTGKNRTILRLFVFDKGWNCCILIHFIFFQQQTWLRT